MRAGRNATQWRWPLTTTVVMTICVGGGSLAWWLAEIGAAPAGLVVAGAVVLSGSFVIQRVTVPLLRRVDEGEARNRAVVETAVDGIMTIDGRGIVQSINGAAERIFGYGAAEVVGRNVNMLMPSPYRQEHDGYLARYLSTGEKRIIGIGREVEGMRKNGQVFPLELAVSEVQPGTLFTGFVRDVSERKELERSRNSLIAQLEEKNAELERFTYTVSHDLKSPLITISGFVGGLEKDARAGNYERLRADVTRITTAVERMKLLLDELLQLSRIGRIVNPPTDIQLGALAHEVMESLEGPLRSRGVTVSVQDGLPTVRGDGVRLHEVLQNLVENAVKFMGETAQPRIDIGMRSGAAEPVYFVRDNGIGVEPQYRDKIFGLFDKLNKDSPGAGIGLALVKRIVELHGGRVWVESEGLGTGATFCFTLSETGRR